MLKMIWTVIGLAVAAWLAMAPASAQNTTGLVVTTCGSPTSPFIAGRPAPFTVDTTGTMCSQAGGGGGGSSTPFAPNGSFATLTATAASSASTALPTGATVAFQNTSSVDVSCVLSTGAATATTNKTIVRGGATVFVAVGANVNAACINQTGSASNVIVMAGGSGLGTNFGGGGSGGGGGAVTIADGADVAEGATTDAAATAGGTGSLSAKMRLMTTQLNTINTTLGSPLQAGGTVTANLGTLNGAATAANQTAAAAAKGEGATGAAVPSGAQYMGINSGGNLTGWNGAVTQSGTWTVQPGNTANTTPWLTSISQGGNTAVVKGASTAASATDPAVVVAISPNGQNANGQATAANSSPVVLAKNSGTGATIAGAAVGTAGSAATEVVTVQGIASGTAIPVSGTVTATGTVAATQSGNWVMQPCTAYHLSGGTAASTNSTSMKASAGTLCRLTLINTQASTLGYLKVYDSATAPTCSSATNLKHVYPILAGPAGVQVIDGMGEVYTNGIAFCVTGGGGDTDNTNAPTGIYVEASYR
jgi:hypothetical protein